MMDGGDLEALRSDILCEFLEVAWHLVLYTRKIYPAALFSRRRKYGTTVWMCRHPELTDYLKDVLKTVRYLLERKELQNVLLVVKSAQGKVLEQFVFELGAFNPSEDVIEADRFLLGVESTLRAFLLRLSACEETLSPLPDSCQFAIVLATREDAAMRLEALSSSHSNRLEWIPAESSAVVEPGNVVHPVKSSSEGTYLLSIGILHTLDQAV